MQRFTCDTEAINALIRSDMCGLEYFYNLYFQGVKSFLNPYCRLTTDADEITQDTFLKLWEMRKRINPDQNLKNLLFTIAKNKAMDEIRKFKSHEAKLNFLELSKDRSFSTFDEIIFADYERVLGKVLAHLPNRNLEVFNLSRKEHLSNKAISLQLNISVKAVEKHISKTLSYLRVFLKNHQISCFIFFTTFFNL